MTDEQLTELNSIHDEVLRAFDAGDWNTYYAAVERHKVAYTIAKQS